MSEEHAGSELQFDKATFEAPQAGIACHSCSKTITDRYWQANGAPLCASCREGVEQAQAEARTGKSFMRAAVRAGAVALACGVAYAVFVGLTDTNLALLTIGIGYLVGASVQKVTRGFGARRHQVLAAVLTYFAACMGNAVPIVKGFRQQAEQRQTAAAGASTQTPPVAPALTGDARATTSPSATPPPDPPSVGGLVIGLIGLFVVCLIAPFFMLTTGGGWLSMAIIAFGIFEAWRRAAGVTLAITGPHEIPAGEVAAHESA